MQTSTVPFRNLGLSEALCQKLDALGFVVSTPIQAQAIPIALRGSDVIGNAQTGTGKTLAFLLPILDKIKHAPSGGSQALILCPTREIALQSLEVAEKVGTDFGVGAVALIGGKRIGNQLASLREQPAIVIATPGRLLDHVDRRSLTLKSIKYLVLDEADHMLDLGFLPQVREILREVPRERQTLMFSATFPASIERLSQQYLKNPERVSITPPGTAAEGIEHHLYLVESEDKRRAIAELIRPGESTLVFTQTKLDAEWLYRLLEKTGLPVHALHSNRSQSERIAVLEKFKKGEFQALVATDILARGIDIDDIAHVINYDVPRNPEDYIHRVGRTARAQKTGIASTLGTWMDADAIRAIEAQLNKKLERRELKNIPAFPESAAPANFGKVGTRGRRVRLR